MVKVTEMLLQSPKGRGLFDYLLEQVGLLFLTITDLLLNQIETKNDHFTFSTAKWFASPRRNSNKSADESCRFDDALDLRLHGIPYSRSWYKW